MIEKKRTSEQKSRQKLRETLDQVRVEKVELWERIVTLKFEVWGNCKFPHSFFMIILEFAFAFQDLVKQLREGSLKALDVLQAYQNKALEVDERLNCVVHVR